jgi:hypothetical protein
MKMKDIMITIIQHESTVFTGVMSASATTTRFTPACIMIPSIMDMGQGFHSVTVLDGLAAIFQWVTAGAIPRITDHITTHGLMAMAIPMVVMDHTGRVIIMDFMMVTGLAAAAEPITRVKFFRTTIITVQEIPAAAALSVQQHAEQELPAMMMEPRVVVRWAVKVA